MTRVASTKSPGRGPSVHCHDLTFISKSGAGNSGTIGECLSNERSLAEQKETAILNPNSATLCCPTIPTATVSEARCSRPRRIPGTRLRETEAHQTRLVTVSATREEPLGSLQRTEPGHSLPVQHAVTSGTVPSSDPTPAPNAEVPRGAPRPVPAQPHYLASLIAECTGRPGGRPPAAGPGPGRALAAA
eukprot:696448-Hanusia_phi.AAC.1